MSESTACSSFVCRSVSNLSRLDIPFGAVSTLYVDISGSLPVGSTCATDDGPGVVVDFLRHVSSLVLRGDVSLGSTSWLGAFGFEYELKAGFIFDRILREGFFGDPKGLMSSFYGFFTALSPVGYVAGWSLVVAAQPDG